MQAIWKFPLNYYDTNFISMPKGAKILSIQNQYEIACIWALIPDITSDTETRIFIIYGTGHTHELIKGNYIGTYQLDNGNLVFHVFEII